MNENSNNDRIWATWFEIPATDFKRAILFYEKLFNIQIRAQDFGNFKIGVFPHDSVGCAICYGEHYTPSKNGVMVYLNANPDLNDFLTKVEGLGGKVLSEKKQISPDHGFMAQFEDSEGNRLVLHSYK